jgi:hypothetical protein
MRKRIRGRVPDQRGHRQEHDRNCLGLPKECSHARSRLANDQVWFSDNELSAWRAMIWIVLGPSELDLTPGLLQQVYAADSAAALRQAPPQNGSIVLQDLTDAKQLGAVAGRQDDLASTIVQLVLRVRTTPT